MSNNNESSGFSVGVVIAVFFAVGVFILFGALAIIIGIVALFALFKPLKIGRKITIQPSEARWYLLRGLIGFLVSPLVAQLIAAFFKVEMTPEWAPWVLLAGYSIGSLGIEYIIQVLNGDDEDEPEPAVYMPPPPPPQARALPPRENNNYQFAAWDDEDVDPYK